MKRLLENTWFAGRRRSFPRGVHPDDAKEIARDEAIEVLPTPPVVRVPLLQHLGRPATIGVKPRTSVQMGECVGEASGPISSPVHASVSGETARSGMVSLANGRRVDTVPIKAFPEQPLEGQSLYEAWLGGQWPLEVPDGISPDAVAGAALEAGLVGQGGAAFPSHVKLHLDAKRPVDTVLINGCECEPYLTADYRLMLESPASVISGAVLLRHATGARRTVVCLENNTSEAAEQLREAAAGTGIEILELASKYPQGGEKSLTYAVMGKAIPTGGLPLDIGAVVLNVSTAASLARKIHRRMNLTHRIVCVSGAGIQRPANLLVPLGTPFSALIKYCGGARPEAVRYVAGGPMMGFSFADTEIPVTKGNGGLTLFTAREVESSAETACLRCGRCVDVCPLDLVPTRIALAVRVNNIPLAQRHHLEACMECGSCAYACPAGIPLVQLIRAGKAAVRRFA